MSFTDKVVVITGGANGIGRCIACEYAKAGAKLALIDTDKENGEKVQAEFSEQIYFYYGDIAQEMVLKNFADAVIKRYGKVDILINNACISKRGILSGCGYEDFNTVLKIGVTAPYMLSMLFLSVFTKGGSIINISSTRARMSQADTESYSAAKGGISALTHALAVSLAGKVRVNSISPGWINTSGAVFGRQDHTQHPAGRVGQPLDIAKAVMFLTGEDAGFITGEDVTVDGGMTKLMIYHDDQGWEYKG